MGRPKSPTTSAEIAAQIERVQHDSQAQVRQLEERQRVAEARENLRRGELILSYLREPKGAELRRILRSIVEPRDRQLFDLQEQQGHSGATTTAPVAERSPA